MTLRFFTISLLPLISAAFFIHVNQEQPKIQLQLIHESSCPKKMFRTEVNSQEEVDNAIKFVEQQIKPISYRYIIWLGHKYDERRKIWINNSNQTVNPFLTKTLKREKNHCPRIVFDPTGGKGFNSAPCPDPSEEHFPTLCSKFFENSKEKYWFILILILAILSIIFLLNMINRKCCNRNLQPKYPSVCILHTNSSLPMATICESQ